MYLFQPVWLFMVFFHVLARSPFGFHYCRLRISEQRYLLYAIPEVCRGNRTCAKLGSGEKVEKFASGIFTIWKRVDCNVCVFAVKGILYDTGWNCMCETYYCRGSYSITASSFSIYTATLHILLFIFLSPLHRFYSELIGELFGTLSHLVITA